MPNQPQLQRVALCEITTRFGVMITHSDRPHSTAIRLLRLGCIAKFSHVSIFVPMPHMQRVTLCEITTHISTDTGLKITRSDRPLQGFAPISAGHTGISVEFPLRP